MTYISTVWQLFIRTEFFWLSPWGSLDLWLGVLFFRLPMLLLQFKLVQRNVFPLFYFMFDKKFSDLQTGTPRTRSGYAHACDIIIWAVDYFDKTRQMNQMIDSAVFYSMFFSRQYQINQIKSNLFDNTNKSKHKQTINDKQPAICVQKQENRKCVERDTKAGDRLR